MAVTPGTRIGHSLGNDGDDIIRLRIEPRPVCCCSAALQLRTIRTEGDHNPAIRTPAAGGRTPMTRGGHSEQARVTGGRSGTLLLQEREYLFCRSKLDAPDCRDIRHSTIGATKKMSSIDTLTRVPISFAGQARTIPSVLK